MATNIIDPNEVNVFPGFSSLGLNGSPDYSDMFIFAELKVQRRSSSILNTDGAGNTTITTENKALKINMMGFNQNTGEYTTRWSDDNNATFENFGITNIKFTTNSSYIPQVEIEFVDIRGKTLNSKGDKNPLHAFNSFPPPIFTLTFKGYYGKGIEYDLHLVKQSMKFDANTGNFVINAHFVARRYGAITDVLFKYIDIVPLMDENINPNSPEIKGIDLSFDTLPKNTRELITRAKQLYDNLDKLKVDSIEAQKLDKSLQYLETAKDVLNEVNDYKGLLQTIKSTNSDSISIWNIKTTNGNDVAKGLDVNSNDANIAKKIKQVQNYDDKIFTSTPDGLDFSKISDRLCLLYEFDSAISFKDNVAKTTSLDSDFDFLIKKFIGEANKIDSTIKNSSIIKYNVNNPIISSQGKKYLGIDITEYYLRMKKNITSKQIDYNTQQQNLKTKINQISIKTIGAPPTIKNIFNVLLKDVGVVFKKLTTVCHEAEIEHNNPINFSKIISNTNSDTKFISAFPLIINNNKEVTDANGNTIKTDDRAYPGDPKLGLAQTYFPEVDFVEKFVDTFLKIQKLENFENLKQSLDADGNNKWIPINPIDSSINILNNGRSSESPYKNLNNVPSIMSEFLNRFYIGSQYSYDSLFYISEGDAAFNFFSTFFGVSALILKQFTNVFDNKNLSIIKFIAESEAINLVNSVKDEKLLAALQILVQSWKKSINASSSNSSIKTNLNVFYDYLKTNVPHYTSLDDQQDSIGNYLLLNDIKISKNRTSGNFMGFEMISRPTMRNNTTSTSNNENDGEENIVDKYLNDVGDSGFFRKLFFNESGFDSLTKENIPFITDQANSDDAYDSDFFNNTGKDDDIILKFRNVLSLSSDKVKAFLIDENVTLDIKLYWLLREFLESLSYFYDGNSILNTKINRKFVFPSIIEIPNFAHLNMGMLAYFFNPVQTLSDETNTSIKYTKKKYGGSFSDVLLFDDSETDAVYIEKISVNDASKLVEEASIFLRDSTEGGFNTLLNSIINMIDEVRALNLSDYIKRGDEYEKRLKGSSDNNGTSYKSIVDKLMEKRYLMNYSMLTFYPFTDVNKNNFIPLNTLNQNVTFKKFNDMLFVQFLNKLESLLISSANNTQNQKSKLATSLDDTDIKNQIYYSFKAIADKWVVGLDNKNILGNTGNLIDEFKFVDRFFNDIGDKVIIDFRPLIDFSKDYDVSVFTVLSRLLSLNGFEFFPVQNFLNFQQQEWQQSFKTFGSSRNLVLNQTPKFICMYIGGTSSQLDDPFSDFKNDGFKDQNSLEQASGIKTGDVKGFKVAFAKQNQSMFKSIDVNTNEHKETNESLAILSDLAQDQSASSPVPKGQNLFSVYEQRSYTCKVEGFGNAMIQPTQYFILENVPLFNGAYLILDVEHNITPNKMMTAFSGVRIRTNPNPLVTDFYTASAPQAGDSNDIGTLVPMNFTDPNNNVFPTNSPFIGDLNNLQIKP